MFSSVGSVVFFRLLSGSLRLGSTKSLRAASAVVSTKSRAFTCASGESTKTPSSPADEREFDEVLEFDFAKCATPLSATDSAGDAGGDAVGVAASTVLLGSMTGVAPLREAGRSTFPAGAVDACGAIRCVAGVSRLSRKSSALRIRLGWGKEAEEGKPVMLDVLRLF